MKLKGIKLLTKCLTQFVEKDFILRDENSHEAQCREVEKEKIGEKSKEYGINCDSAVNELECV